MAARLRAAAGAAAPGTFVRGRADADDERERLARLHLRGLAQPDADPPGLHRVEQEPLAARKVPLPFPRAQGRSRPLPRPGGVVPEIPADDSSQQVDRRGAEPVECQRRHRVVAHQLGGAPADRVAHRARDGHQLQRAGERPRRFHPLDDAAACQQDVRQAGALDADDPARHGRLEQGGSVTQGERRGVLDRRQPGRAPRRIDPLTGEDGGRVEAIQPAGWNRLPIIRAEHRHSRSILVAPALLGKRAAHHARGDLASLAGSAIEA